MADACVAERVPGLDDGPPAGAAAEVGLQRPLHRRVVVGVGGALARRASRRTTIPGVQKPHWLPPVAQSASAQRVTDRRVEPVDAW